MADNLEVVLRGLGGAPAPAEEPIFSRVASDAPDVTEVRPSRPKNKPTASGTRALSAGLPLKSEIGASFNRPGSGALSPRDAPRATAPPDERSAAGLAAKYGEPGVQLVRENSLGELVLPPNFSSVGAGSSVLPPNFSIADAGSSVDWLLSLQTPVSSARLQPLSFYNNSKMNWATRQEPLTRVQTVSLGLHLLAPACTCLHLLAHLIAKPDCF